MGTAVLPAKTSAGPWNAFADVNAVVDDVLAELTAMAAGGTRPIQSGPKPPLVGAALRKAVMAIWCVCFCGMQWRAIGQLSTKVSKTEGHCWRIRSWPFVPRDDALVARSYLRIEGPFYQWPGALRQ